MKYSYFQFFACTPQVTVSELFKSDVIIASLHLTSCRPVVNHCVRNIRAMKRQSLQGSLYSCVLKASILHYLNFRFCLCIFISGHHCYCTFTVYDRLTSALVQGEQDFSLKVVTKLLLCEFGNVRI